jgi:hypothetical protein
MTKKENVNSIKDGDLSNIIVLRSVWGKANQNYVLQPQRDKNGQWPQCVRRVDVNGDMILSENDKAGNLDNLVPEDEQIVVHDGTVFDLNKPHQAAQWEAIKNCFLIAPDRYAKDEKGNYLIDGSTDINSQNNFGRASRYGRAELYIERPGMEAKKRLTVRKLKLQAQNFILNDEGGYEGWLRMARVLGRNMSNLPAADVEEFLFSVAEKTPEKIIELYTGGDIQLRLLFSTAKEKKVIKRRQNIYYYGNDQQVILGASEEAVIDWMKDPKNVKTLELIRHDTFPEMFGE